MKPRRVLIIIAVAGIGALVGVWAFRASSKVTGPSTPTAAETERAEPPGSPPPHGAAEPPSPPPASAPSPVAAAPVAAVTPPAAPGLSELQIMDELHALGPSNPTRSLELAREGNRRFRRSADAPERASVIVRALSSMGRHDEARAEARKMQKEYPHTEWTSDVHRHMFLNPPNHPAERGHGKTLEVE